MLMDYVNEKRAKHDGNVGKTPLWKKLWKL